MHIGALVVAVIIGMAGVASAASGRLSVRDAITIAAGSNQLVRAAGYKAEAAQQGVTVARSGYFPVLSFEEVFSATNAPTQSFMMKLDEGRFSQSDFQIANLNNPGVQHDFRTALLLQQPLYNPATSPTVDLAAAESQRQAIMHDAAKQEAAFRAFEACLEIQQAKARLETAERAIREAKESMRLATVRREAGTGLRSDELRARTHLSSAEQELIAEHNRIAIARMRLALLLGMQDSEALDVDEKIGVIPMPYRTDELITIALENSSTIRQSKVERERSEAEVKLARAGYLPSVGAFASYQLNAKDAPFSADNDAWTAGVALKWQIFDGFRRGGERKRAAAERSAATEMLEQAANEVRFRIRESALRYEDAGARLSVARDALNDAEETVRLLTKRFENSLATMVELLDAQTALNKMRAAVIEREAEQALAGGRLYYTAGIFLKEMVK